MGLDPWTPRESGPVSMGHAGFERLNRRAPTRGQVVAGPRLAWSGAETGESMVGGIDIGGTKIAVGLARPSGELVARDSFATPSAGGPLRALLLSAARLEAMVEEQEHQLRAVGVGCCGPLDRLAGRILDPPNLPGWRSVPLVEVLREALGVPIFLENDCNAAALGQLRFGAGRGVDDFLYVTISTGIGAGIVVGRKLYRGLGDGAGEMGHQTLDPRGPVCRCGNRGCLEALASGTALARRAREAALRGENVAAITSRAPCGGGEIEARHVVEAARDGDPLARRLCDETLEWLAIGIANAITLLAPRRVILGGGLAFAWGNDALWALRTRIGARVRLVPVDAVEIVLAEHGTDAGLHGAVAAGIEGLEADSRSR